MPGADMAVTRSSDRDASRRRVRWVLALVVAYMGAEVVGGLLANSLALLADAGHMLSDAGSLALTLFALRIAARPPTAVKTFGYHRTEILAALAQGVALVLVTVYVFWQAWQRFFDPPEVMGPLMLGIAVGGLVVNGAGLALLHQHQRESLNIRGAWLHVLADTLGSVGAITAAGLIWWRGWHLADPVASVVIGVLVLASAWKLLTRSTSVLMESAPSHIDVDEVREALLALEGVQDVHHVHAWTITSGLHALSAHLVTGDDPGPSEAILERARDAVQEFGVDHVTIQVEPHGFAEPELPT